MIRFKVDEMIKRDDYITENFPSRDIPYGASIFDDLKGGGGVGKFFQKLDVLWDLI